MRLPCSEVCSGDREISKVLGSDGVATGYNVAEKWADDLQSTKYHT